MAAVIFSHVWTICCTLKKGGGRLITQLQKKKGKISIYQIFNHDGKDSKLPRRSLEHSILESQKVFFFLYLIMSSAPLTWATRDLTPSLSSATQGLT